MKVRVQGIVPCVDRDNTEPTENTSGVRQVKEDVHHSGSRARFVQMAHATAVCRVYESEGASQ